MSVVSAVALAPSQSSKTDNNRRSALFHPNVWGDYFLSYASNFEETEYRIEHQKLKEEVRQMLLAVSDKPIITKLDLIDSVQRSGVHYHFEREIDEMLQQMKTIDSNCCDQDKHDSLYSISLRFRLLRQHGYRISCDMFEKFKDGQGNFKESLTCDVRGMLSLYEATHLRIHGEDILEEALAFTTTHLHSMAATSPSPLSEQISHALRQPLHKNLPRLEAKRYVSSYQEDSLHNEVLLRFAKLDFNILQQQHRKELRDITWWWKDLDVSSKLSFARDRITECYFWVLGVYFEPEYFLGRKILTKVMAMTSILDDIYDVHGTIEELELLTEAIEIWDISATKHLPKYLKVFYEALLDVFNEIKENMLDEGKLYRIDYAKEGVKNLARAYWIEAKWFHHKYVPTMEEYMPVGLGTSTYSLLSTTSFVGMGDNVTKDVFDWILSYPKMITAASVICRLTDDIVSHEFEQKRGHVASSVECYMKQHDTTRQQAVDEFYRQVSEAWKDINEECLNPTSLPMPLLMRIINLARVIDVAYKDGDGYTFSEVLLKDSVTSLLIDPMPL
ncbi:(-)-germacrene D synthase-like [Durio zibethinus]|uniref:(+)-delta-cadinene synthase n=1 Tax=Durio zibethinus TaxID=66656 RepID=A0A6P5ZM37_DURZI|nr:(-)-germacrene D synthase-like [Durio zibethinus]